MVAVDSENRVLSINTTIVCEGIPYMISSITPPENGEAGFIMITDLIHNITIKAFPTKFGGRWANEDETKPALTKFSATKSHKLPITKRR